MPLPAQVDVLIVGAGLSGIGAAWHLQARCPTKTYAIVESRDAIGGTWDLFRYPGVRSDSDMYTLGYGFQPWPHAQAIADGPVIRDYIRDTAREHAIEQHIRVGHRVTRAAWDSGAARWTVTIARAATSDTVTIACGFVMMCAGYFNYAHGHAPRFLGRDRFAGPVIHPQAWPEDLDYRGKRVVVIGSGATAVTLVPAMAATAAHVVMLQRSPSYVVSMPREDRVAAALRRRLPASMAYRLIRARNIALSSALYQLARRRPMAVRAWLSKQAQTQLGAGFDMRHFTPTYAPWDQRLCAVPDGDLFAAIKAGRASVVTDTITSFTERGVQLASGAELAADIIVTATGLELQLMGGATLTVDGKPIELARTLNYKGVMLQDVPNLSLTVGYTNASWTLKADLVAQYVCRLLGHMDATGTRACTPRCHDPSVHPAPFMDLASGYIERAAAMLPKQGTKAPWRLRQNYPADLVLLRYGALDDGTLEFGNRAPAIAPAR